MGPLMTTGDARLLKASELGEDGKAAAPAEPLLDTITRRGTLRVGVFADRLPFVFINREGHLVGFDVEMAQLFARDLGVKVEFVEMEAAGPVVPRLLTTDTVDVAMTGFPVTAGRASQILHSEPYLDETLAFVVKDRLRENFSSWANIRELGGFSVLIPALPYFSDVVRTRAPALQLTRAASMMQIEQALKNGTSDAVVLPAERGSVLSLLYPKYTVVVPEPGIVKIPLAYPVAHRDRTIEALYGHWVLGKQAVKCEPRWSIMRNVLDGAN
jgi:ABC-type amino acid transport substrate-binding protein